jgi:hypothetical protein
MIEFHRITRIIESLITSTFMLTIIERDDGKKKQTLEN